MSPDRNKRFLVASNEALTAAAIVLLPERSFCRTGSTEAGQASTIPPPLR